MLCERQLETQRGSFLQSAEAKITKSPITKTQSNQCTAEWCAGERRHLRVAHTHTHTHSHGSTLLFLAETYFAPSIFATVWLTVKIRWSHVCTLKKTLHSNYNHSKLWSLALASDIIRDIFCLTSCAVVVYWCIDSWYNTFMNHCKILMYSVPWNRQRLVAIIRTTSAVPVLNLSVWNSLLALMNMISHDCLEGISSRSRSRWAHRSHFLPREDDISGTLSRKYFTFGTNITLKSKMKWYDFGSQMSKVMLASWTLSMLSD